MVGVLYQKVALIADRFSGLLGLQNTEKITQRLTQRPVCSSRSGNPKNTYLVRVAWDGDTENSLGRKRVS